MLCSNGQITLLFLLGSFLFSTVTRAEAAKPTAAQALQLMPIQTDVDFDRPDPDEAAKCRLEPETARGISGWVVQTDTGRLLRRFLDTNSDKKVDLWCYYKDGIEVYRDIDSNYNGKADQYRWLGTAGIRWGLDTNEDGRIDSWKMISPEEVTAEVVAALRERDSTRFEQLLLTKDELKSIGLGSDQTKDLSTRITAAAGGFRDLARKQQSVGPKSEWIHFGASRPGVVPSGTEGSTQDLIVYDNVAAVIETDGKHAQVSVGTLIRVGDNWRVIDLPKNLLAEDAGTVPTGFFFNASFVRPSGAEAIPDAGFSETVQKLIAEYERVDRELGSARGAQLTQLNARRAELLEQLADATSDGAERTNWIRQYADTISAAVQSDAFPDGVNRLKAYYEKLAKTPRDSDLAAYVKFRYLTAEYGQSLQQKDADFAKIQSHWMENLEAFVKEFPRGQDTAEAMLQLALGQEFAGNESDAKNWYRRIVSDFPSTQLATKAAGATRRLDSIGQTIELRGKTTDGRTLDLATYRGKTVLIHYWATWCEPCKEEFTILKQMQAKYAKQGLEVIGVSLDSDAQTLATYLRSNRLAWPQLYEDGGLDSRLANELGILTLPTMILVDSKGKVISRNIHAGELDAELGKQLR